MSGERLKDETNQGQPMTAEQVLNEGCIESLVQQGRVPYVMMNRVTQQRFLVVPPGGRDPGGYVGWDIKGIAYRLSGDAGMVIVGLAPITDDQADKINDLTTQAVERIHTAQVVARRCPLGKV